MNLRSSGEREYSKQSFSFLCPVNIVLYQYLKKGTFFLLFVEGWVCGTKHFQRFSVNSSMASAGKNPGVEVKCLFSLNAFEL